MKRKITVTISMLILLLSLTACSDVAREAFEEGWNDGIGTDTAVIEKGQTAVENKASEINVSDSVLYSKNGTTILLKNDLPSTVNYAIGGAIDSTTEILEISVGKETYTGIRIDVKCKKTYEKEKNTPCAFQWKLYDSSNLLIESGPITNDAVTIGEQFKESFTVFEELGSETYTLVFADFE